MSRGRISPTGLHLSWLGLLLVATLVAHLAGARLGPAFAMAAILSLPAWTGLGLAGRPSAPALSVAAWTCATVSAVILSGGLASPALGLIGLGPLAVHGLFGRNRSHEALAFAGVAGLAVIGLTLGGAPATLVAPGEVWPFTCAGITAAGLHQLRLRRRTGGARKASTAQRARAADAARRVQALGARLPIAAPVAMLRLDEAGMVRAVEGNPSLLRASRLGIPAGDALPGMPGETLARLLACGGEALIGDLKGGALRVHATVSGSEARVVVTEVPPGPDQRAITAAVAERTRAFAALGHDLKTPMNAILGFADLMRSELRGPLPEGYRDYAALIHESGEDLLLLIDDMLDYAKAEAGAQRLDIEPVDLAASGQSVHRQLSHQAVRRGVRLSICGEDEAWAAADARAVRQIWQNLVSNAIKFTGEGGQVTMATGVAEGHAVLSVEDTGQGMSAADLARVAEPFARGENARGRVGTGLGLAVVRRFADLMGGTVRIDTAPGAGTRVEVRLPASDAVDLGLARDAAE